MKWTHSLIPTLRQPPKEAEASSHQWMLRGGFARQLSSGVYSYLPIGFRVLKKIMDIVREEMNRAGAEELLMPGLHPAELWKRTGRYESLGEDKFAFKNRAGQEYVLGPTHEEVITQIAAENIQSYKQLPVTLYQIQTKFRDEARPRFGVIRSKEFIMKDAYSFDKDEEGLDLSYQKMYEAYGRIFTRCGLKFEAVEADPGLMGGNFSHEFMLLADFGEDVISRCVSCGHRSSREITACLPISKGKTTGEPRALFDTPGLKTIEDLARAFKIKPEETIKALVYVGGENALMVLVRGDHEANEAKIRRAAACTSLRLATPDEIFFLTGAPLGFVGPADLNKKIPVYADHAVMALGDAVAGGNAKDKHARHVVPGRDFKPDHVADLRYATEGDPCPACQKGKITLARAMEIGHVFKLGTRYSKSMEAFFLSEESVQKPLIMGCYGIGVNRIMAGAIEQNHDEKGIRWPMSIAPFSVMIVTINESHPQTHACAEGIYQMLTEAGIDVLYDDRDERAGVKFNDADLVGIPLQVIIGERGLKQGKVEIKQRNQPGSPAEQIPVEDAISHLRNLYTHALTPLSAAR